MRIARIWYRPMLNDIKNFVSQRRELLFLLVLLCISALAHGFNMFNFPYYENDEGVYLSQAWSLLKESRLAPYTYWYDHAPMGWIITSFWTSLTGGLHTFGFSLNTGRVFMLVIHVLSTYLVFRITKVMTSSLAAAGIASLLFSLSPLGIYFHRRLLLDNIMIFLVLWSFYLLIDSKNRIHKYILSAVIFGLAVLTKENAVFFIPAFVYTIYFGGHKAHRKVMTLKWILIVGFIVSFYFLYALLKAEFFPSGSSFGNDQPHVSLLETLAYQASRDGGSVLEPATSSFWKNVRLWLLQDYFLVVGGVIATIVLLIIAIAKKKHLYIGLCGTSIFFWWFLARGGIVIEFYVVPLIPLFGIIISILMYEASHLFKSTYLKGIYFFVLYIAVLSFYFKYGRVSMAFGQNNTGHGIYTSKQTLGQLNAVGWIQKNIPSDAMLIIDNYSFLDLRFPRNKQGRAHNKAHWYWKVNHDKEVRDDVLHNSAENIDYIAVTPQMRGDLEMGVSGLVTEALGTSIIIKSFNTDGWGVEIWATRYPNQILKRSWESYKLNYIHNNSYVIDPANNLTTSEGQSYALLQAVWLNDKKTFDGVWKWTKDNLINDSGTIAWSTKVSKTGVVTINDAGSAADGDTDTALALIFASKKWKQSSYLADARELLDAVWKLEVKELNGKYYLVPGPWAKGRNEVVVNPSYLSPYAYRIFAQADTEHPWKSLVDTSYEALEGCTTATYGSTTSSVGLPPNWCALTSEGDYVQSSIDGLSSTEYSYDAVRTMWRLALDYKWYKDARALKYLNRSKAFFDSELKNDGSISTGYTHTGEVFDNYESTLGNSFVLANYSVTDSKKAEDFYKEKIQVKFYEDFEKKLSYWEVPDNYYTQNWAWFNTALYANRLPNLWEEAGSPIE